MDLKKNDKLVCKKSIGIFRENNTYTITNIFSYSTLNVTLPADSWRGNFINSPKPEHFYLITIENVQFSGDENEIYLYFYTKKETIKLKLEKLK